MTDHRVAIVGGGLAGLNAARILAEGESDVLLFEAESEPGGRVRTEQVDGFRLDRGFQVLFTAYPEVRRSIDMSALDPRPFRSGVVVCRENHRSVLADPLRDPLKAVETAFSRDVSIGDKYRVLRLRQELAGRDADSIFRSSDREIRTALEGRGFSDRFVRNLAEPLFGGITLDPTLSTSSRVFEFVFKMLAEGTAVVPAGGMGQLSAQLADRARTAGATIETETTVDSIERDGLSADNDTDGSITIDFDTGRTQADRVIVATNPPEAKNLTDVASIPTEGRGTITQHFSLPSGNPVGDQPRLLLNAGGSVPNHVAVMSAVAPEYAPDGKILLSANTPGDREESDEELARATRETLSSWYPEASFEDLELRRTHRIQFGQFAQPPGIHETLPDVGAPGGNVFLAGEYTEHSSIQGALSSGRRAAEAVRASVG
ncbi:MAG: NAD(P)/FAD-dependent oxidoreductase [Halodesulfurarchaeum sp.]